MTGHEELEFMEESLYCLRIYLKRFEDGLAEDLKRGFVSCGMSRAIGGLFIWALSDECNKFSWAIGRGIS